jgi:hypothetical protein
MWEQTKNIFLGALDRLTLTLARLIPGLLAMLLILLIAVLLAILLRIAVRRLCARVELDRRLREWGMAHPASTGRTAPSVLIVRVVTWTVVLLGFLAGLNVFETTSTLALRLLEYLPNVLTGLAILAIGFAGSRAVERSILIGAVNMGLQSARLLGLGVRWLVVILAVAMALERFGLGGTILVVFFAILFGGIVLALSLAVGLGSRDAVARSLDRRTGPAQEDPLPDDEAKQPKTVEEIHHL